MAAEIDFEPVPDGEARRQELADFLRSRRERATPEHVGIVPGGRRRTPGLRREEVAQLAGVGVTWYTWLEQGRDIKASDQVLDAVARTFRLDRYEREHLFTLAGSATAHVARECDEVAPGTLLVLERLGNYPAVVLNGRYDVLAYNRAYEALVGDLGSLCFDERNVLWLIFTSPTMRELLVDWEQVARTCVARYRAAYGDPCIGTSLARPGQAAGRRFRGVHSHLGRTRGHRDRYHVEAVRPRRAGAA